MNRGIKQTNEFFAQESFFKTEKRISGIKIVLSIIASVLTLSYFPGTSYAYSTPLIETLIYFLSWGFLNFFIYFFSETKLKTYLLPYFSILSDVLLVVLIQRSLLKIYFFDLLLGPVSTVYFLIVALAALRKSKKMVWISSLICALSHLGLIYFSFVEYIPQMDIVLNNISNQSMSWSFENEVIFSFIIIFFGAIVGHVTDTLLKKEHHYMELFESIPDGIIILSPGMKILAANKKCEELFGLKRKYILKNTISQLWETVTQQEYPSISNYSEIPFSLIIKKNDGTTIPIQISTVKKSVENIEYYTLSILDIRKQVELESQLERFSKVQTVAELSCSLANDFSNILGEINEAVQVCQDGANILPDENKKNQIGPIFEAINECTITGDKILERLCSISKTELVLTDSFDLNEMISETITVLQNTCPKNITISLRNKNKHINIQADKTFLSQALLNLCLNSIDAIGDKDDGQITIKAYKTRPREIKKQPLLNENSYYICIEVEDNGIGISEEVKAKMFDPFFTTKKVGKGTGIGLTMVNYIVAGHGGTLDISSKQGTGTIIRMYIEANRESLLPFINS